MKNATIATIFCATFLFACGSSAPSSVPPHSSVPTTTDTDEPAPVATSSESPVPPTVVCSGLLPDSNPYYYSITTYSDHKEVVLSVANTATTKTFLNSEANYIHAITVVGTFTFEYNADVVNGADATYIVNQHLYHWNLPTSDCK